MPITNISKTAGAASIECGGAVDISLAIAAAPGAATQRVAIALILDRSGSMAGNPMLHLKAGAKEFVNIITEANGNRIYSFADLTTEIDQASAGDAIELKVYRYYDESGNLTGDYEELYFSVVLEVLD